MARTKQSSKEASQTVAGASTKTAKEASQAVAEATTKKPSKKTTFRRVQKIVYVIVGPEGQKFGMHQDHLCANSPYFKSAFEGKFQEAELGEVTLKDTSVATFEMFNEWLYTGEIAEELCEENNLTDQELHAKDKPTINQLFDVWLLADYLLVPKLQNYAVDMMIAKQKNRNIIPTGMFRRSYKDTQPGSLMRKLTVDIFVWKWDTKSSEYRECADQIPSEMTMDLVIAFARRVTKEDENPFQIAGHYHVPVKD